MPCEDAPCCGCCTPMTEQDQREAAEAHWEMEELGVGEDMDGDFDSAMASAGFGTDEDYGMFSDDMQCEGYDEN